MMFSIVIFSVLITSVYAGAGQVEYYNLVTNMFTTYNSYVRPTDDGEITLVFMNMVLKSIVGLDEKNQVLSSYVTLKAQWVDPYLQWNISDYANISRILYPQKNLWVPDIINENSVRSQAQLGYNELVCSISHDGTVEWTPSEILETSCDIDVTYYPFDTQSCNITFTAVLSTRSEVEIDPFSSETSIDLTEYSESGTWELLLAEAIQPDESDGSSRISFNLKLKRLRQYYVMNIILPLLLLSVTASMVFLLPAEAGEKIGLSITVLLSFAVYLTIINDEIPKTSRQISILSVYLICLLAVTTMSVVFSIVVLHNHHKGEEILISAKLASWTRKTRQLLGLTPTKPTARANRVHPSEETISLDSLPLKKRSYTSKSDRSEILKNELKSKPEEFQSERLFNDPHKELITWPKVAETLDRIFFLIFTFIIISLTVITLPLMVLLAP